MAFLQELASDKEKLLKFFLSDRNLVDLLSNGNNVQLPAIGLKYKQVYPYHWLSSTITEQKSYLCFSVIAPKTLNCAVKDVLMKIWVFSHDGIMRTDNGPRIDLLAGAIDDIINGSTAFGLGKVELKGMHEITPAKDFYGYEIDYEVKDFNRICGRL